MAVPRIISWRTVEKAGIYASLFAALALTIVGGLPYPIANKIPSNLPISLFGVALIGALHYVIRAVEDMRLSPHLKTEARSFPEAYRKWLGKETDVSEMDIAAFTSTVYYHFIEADLIRVKKLRLLLFFEEDLKISCAGEAFDLDSTLEQWLGLQKRGRIEEIEIKRIPMQSSIFFSVIDSERSLVGLLWPNPSFSDTKATRAFVVKRDEAPALIQYLTFWFESMWSCGLNLIQESDERTDLKVEDVEEGQPES